MRPRVSAHPKIAGFLVACGLFASACGDEIGLPADPDPGVRYPVAMVANPAGTRLYVAGANFDRGFRAGVLRVLDTTTDKFLPAKVEIPSFAAGMALQLQADGTPGRALVVAREDDSLSLIDLAGDTLSCGTPDADGRCDSAHRYGTTDATKLGSDPVDVFLEPLVGGAVRAHVVATSDGQVSVLEVAEPGQPGPPVRLGTLDLGAGLSGVVFSPLSGRGYVSDSRSNVLHVYRVEATPTAKAPFQLVSEPPIGLPAAQARDFGRALALSSDGGRLYVAWRSPNALVVVDIAPTRAGVPRHAVLDVIGIGAQPARVAVAPTGPGGSDLAYVSCFGEDTVWIVDPALRAVVGVIRLPHAPFDLTPVRVGNTWKLYAALFNRSDLAIVPLLADGRGADVKLLSKVKP